MKKGLCPICGSLMKINKPCGLCGFKHKQGFLPVKIKDGFLVFIEENKVVEMLVKGELIIN